MTLNSILKLFIPMGLLLFPAIGLYAYTTSMCMHISLFDLFIIGSVIIIVFLEKPSRTLRLMWLFMLENTWLFLIILNLILHSFLLFIFIEHLHIQLYLRDVSKVILLVLSVFIIAYVVWKMRIEEKHFILPGLLIAVLYYKLAYSIIHQGFDSVSRFFINTDWAKITIIGHSLVFFSLIVSNWLIKLPKDNRYYLLFYILVQALIIMTLHLLLRNLWMVCVVMITLSTLWVIQKDSLLNLISNYFSSNWGTLKKFAFVVVLTFIVAAVSYKLININEVLISLNSRLLLWKAAIEISYHSFPMGIGLGQFSVALKKIMPDAINSYVHNQFLTLIVEMGLLGILMGFTLLYGILKISENLPLGLRLSFIFYVLATLLSHDAFGIRSFYVLISYSMLFFARFQRSNDEGFQNSVK